MSYIQMLIFSSVAIGLLVGIIGTVIITYKNVDAILNVDISNSEKDLYSLMILCPIEELHKKKYLIVEVQNDRKSNK